MHHILQYAGILLLFMYQLYAFKLKPATISVKHPLRMSLNNPIPNIVKDWGEIWVKCISIGLASYLSISLNPFPIIRAVADVATPVSLTTNDDSGKVADVAGGTEYDQKVEDSNQEIDFQDENRINRGATLLRNPTYAKGLVSTVKSDDFWYPPYLIGNWRTSLTFIDASFIQESRLSTDEIESAAEIGIIPGFKKYSVFFAPRIGKNVQINRRYVQVDSHPREDHSYNIRQLVQGFEPDTFIDRAPYSYQLSPSWFYIPANHFEVQYHDSTGKGIVELESFKRDIEVTAGTVETSETFHQTHRRYEEANLTPKISKSEYTIVWKLQAPEAVRDEFITNEKLRSVKKLLGSLDILVYLPPTSDLYLKNPSRPVGVFSYDVVMDRLVDPNDMKTTEYPYVPSNDGAVELQDFFGY